MLLSYSRPTGIAFTINGTGGAFLTDSARLVNGRPSSPTRIQYISGTQTLTSVLDLRADWGTDGQIIVGFAGLIGLSLPVGLRIVCSFKFSGLWGYSPQEGVVFEREDGVRCVWFYFPQTIFSVPFQGVQFSVYNNVGGTTSPLAANEPFDIGELWAGEASLWCIRPTYQSDREDYSKMKTSLGGQPFKVTRRASNISQLEFTPVIYSEAFGTGTFGTIRERILGYKPCVVVPMTTEPFTGSAIDSTYINRHAEFGYAKNVGPIVGEAPRFVFSATFNAPPALLP